MIKLNHKNLSVYKTSIELVSEIYQLTTTFPSSETYGITNQLRRASVSIPSNIAEGSARPTTPDRIRFYQIARSSLVEIDTQIQISLNLGYLTKEDITKLSKLSNQVFAMLSKMIQ